MVKILTCFFSITSVLAVVEAFCDDAIKVQITPTIEKKQIQNFTINLEVYHLIDVGTGGPHSGFGEACDQGCNQAGIGYISNATKKLTKRCGNFIDRQFDNLTTMRIPNQQWYVSDFDITETASTGLYNVALMSLMIIKNDNDGKPL
jgi:hypothetical protein